MYCHALAAAARGAQLPRRPAARRPAGAGLRLRPQPLRRGLLWLLPLLPGTRPRPNPATHSYPPHPQPPLSSQDADDVAAPRRVEAQLAAALAAGPSTLVGCRYSRGAGGGRPRDTAWRAPPRPPRLICTTLTFSPYLFPSVLRLRLRRRPILYRHNGMTQAQLVSQRLRETTLAQPTWRGAHPRRSASRHGCTRVGWRLRCQPFQRQRPQVLQPRRV